METVILVFLGLIFAHLLADYPLQGEFLANMKGKNHIILVSHAGIWTGTIAVAAILMGLDVGLIDILLLFIVHAYADWMKAANKFYYQKFDALKGGLAIDQMIHVGQILLLMVMTL